MIAQHGGDVWRVAEEFRIPVEEILDFSSNINPRGLPEKARQRLERDAADSRLLSFYPDPTAGRLREALSERLGIPSESIVIGPGAEALLAPSLKSLRARRALVRVPAFSEYRRVCVQLEIEYSQELASQTAGDVTILNNPHNPSGALMEACEVAAVVEEAKAAGASVLVDEAFIDYVPHASVVKDAVGDRGLVVLRSLTKFYGCPALRVGYAVGHAETIQHIRDMLPTWGVTQFAMDALAEAVTDREYAEASIRENEVERERLAVALRELGFCVARSAANFLLLELRADMPTSSELRMRMIQRNRILIRNCDSYEGLDVGRFVRVAVKSGAENRRLMDGLRQCVEP